jgi:uncharacterized membrane-anchored protein
MSGRTVWFALALVVQGALLAAVPWDREADESSAQTIWLKAKAGGDRHRDVLRGEYINLTYDISDPAKFAEVKPAIGAELRRGETAYAVLQEMQPGLWTGLRIERELPSDLPDGQAAIKGEWSDRGEQIKAYLHREADGTWAADSIITGEMDGSFDHDRGRDKALASAWVSRQAISYRDIASYFVPQSERRRTEEDLLAHPDEVVVQVRVGEGGSASLLQMRIQDRVYDF